MIVAMTCGLCVSVRGLVSNYLGYPINVGISIINREEVTFPAITICNMCPVRKSLKEAAAAATAVAGASVAKVPNGVSKSAGVGVTQSAERRRKRRSNIFFIIFLIFCLIDNEFWKIRCHSLMLTNIA